MGEYECLSLNFFILSFKSPNEAMYFNIVMQSGCKTSKEYVLVCFLSVKGLNKVSALITLLVT